MRHPYLKMITELVVLTAFITAFYMVAYGFDACWRNGGAL